jgi:hypothetical protein
MNGWLCDCGSPLAKGDHGRCWMLSAYGEDEMREALR